MQRTYTKAGGEEYTQKEVDIAIKKVKWEEGCL